MVNPPKIPDKIFLYKPFFSANRQQSVLPSTCPTLNFKKWSDNSRSTGPALLKACSPVKVSLSNTVAARWSISTSNYLLTYTYNPFFDYTVFRMWFDPIFKVSLSFIFEFQGMKFELLVYFPSIISWPSPILHYVKYTMLSLQNYVDTNLISLSNQSSREKTKATI